MSERRRHRTDHRKRLQEERIRRNLAEVDHTGDQRGDDAGIQQHAHHLKATPFMNADGGHTVDKKEQIDGDEEQCHIDDCLIAVHTLYERQPHEERVVEPKREVHCAAQPSAIAQENRQQETDGAHHHKEDGVVDIGVNDLRQIHVILRVHR